MRPFWALAAWALSLGASPPPQVDEALILGDTLPSKLSQFRLLFGPYGRTPNTGVTPYTLSTPLFSDYAEKFRFAYVPRGQKARWTGEGLVAFPVGSVLVKSFGYPADMRAPDKDVRILETRLLMRRASGWVALPYVWNADGSDADLKRAGTRIDVKWTHNDGTERAISYAVPNVNQCKGCHDRGGAITLIGPKGWNLSPDFLASGLVEGVPAARPRMPRWDDTSASIAERARAYLDVNCGHCHSRDGPANTSGLWLDRDQPAGPNLGLNKRPTAAGRGSGDFDFAIDPGHPERSILIHRMRSLDPGVAMPELGRATVHEEGVALLSDWIRTLK